MCGRERHGLWQYEKQVNNPNTQVNSFSIFHHNVQGLTSKLTSLEVLIESFISNPSIVCLTEHWLRKDAINMLNFNNYTIISSFCRENHIRGGSLILVKNELCPFVKEAATYTLYSSELDFECSAIHIEKHNLIIVNIYRSHLGSFQNFLDSLENMLTNIRCIHKKNIIICGDFNIDFLTEKKEKQQVESIIHSFNVKYVIKQPTRITSHCKTAIDNVLTNIDLNDVTYEIIDGLSDHTCQLITVKRTNDHIYKPQIFEKRNFNHINVRKFITTLQTEPWTELYNSNSTTDKMFTTFMNSVYNIFDKTFPIIKIRVNKRQKKGWISNEVKHYSKLKRKFIRDRQIAGKKDNSFTNFIRRYKQLIKNTKRKYYLSKILGSKNKTKKLWEVVNEGINMKQKQKSTNIRLITEGTLIENPADVSEAFNSYFVEVVKKLNTNNPPQAQGDAINLLKKNKPLNPYCIFLAPTTEHEVYRELRNLNESKSVGDEIPVWIIKQCSNILAPILSYLFNKCFESGIFPTILKKAKIHPVYKRGERFLLENYRPISLLPTFSKILEKLIQNRLKHFLIKHKIITEQQHGFVSNKSTTTASYTLINSILEGLNNKHNVFGIFCDLTKAFDLVNHNILLAKLEHYGVRGIVLQIIKSYLQDRQQSVEIIQNVNGNRKRFQSNYSNLLQGVPQGSILGPMLFLLYINDLPESIPDAQLILYADDTSAIIKHECIQTLQEKITNTIQQLKHWFHCNKLILNERKTHFVHFHTRQNNNINLLNNDTSYFKLTKEIQFLGLTVNENLNWESHIQTLKTNLNSKIYALRILKDTLDVKSLIQVYYAICHSLIRYGIIFWGSSHNSEEIFKKQKQALRTIIGLENRDSCKEYFRSHKILTIPSLYIFEVALFIKKYCLHTHMKSNIYNVRHQNNLETYIPKLTLVQRGPLHMGIKIYNKLPEAIKNKSTVTSFRNSLKKYLQLKVFYRLDDYLNDLCI